jgi:MSHA pilin protein MshA
MDERPFNRSIGFTLIELIAVIAILGILATLALPRFMDMTKDAKVAALESIAGSMRSTITLTQAKARANGLEIASAMPLDQSSYVLEFPFGRAEVDWRNLCPESSAELGDSLRMIDFLQLSSDQFDTPRIDNQYTLIGFDVPDAGLPTNQGCYVIYDSFGDPNCSVEIVTADCG